MSDRYLVTGGAGFIGSHIVDSLLARGHEVRVLDNFSTGRRQNLDHVQDAIELVEGDIRSYERVHNAVSGCRFVVHLAALPSVPRSVQDPLTTHEVNATGTLNVMLASRDAGSERVVLASSSSIYGANAELPKREDLVPLPVSPYGVSKLAAERYAHSFFHVYGLETVSLRYFNVFGPRQDPASQYSAVIPRFIVRGSQGQPLHVYGDGEQTRDFTYVDNVVSMTLAACTAPGAEGRTFNIGCGERHSLNSVIKTIEELVGVALVLDHRPPRDGDIRDSWADVSEAISCLGVQPTVSLREGLGRTVASLLPIGGDEALRS